MPDNSEIGDNDLRIGTCHGVGLHDKSHDCEEKAKEVKMLWHPRLSDKLEICQLRSCLKVA